MNRSLFSLLFAMTIVSHISADAQPSTPSESSLSTSSNPVSSSPVKAEEESQDLKAEQIATLSEAFGHMLAQHIKTLGIEFNVAQLIKGLHDADQGKPSPMDEMKCVEALTAARQQAFLRLSKKNLQEAEKFIQDTAKKEGVHSIEEGKLYYQIERKGEGLAVAQGHTPLIRYKGSFIDGTVFGASKEDDVVALDETIPGFGKGLLGMKEGEKRILYIHPELAYGTNGQLPPNSLLVFEIDLIKANAPEKKSQSITSAPQEAGVEKEITQSELPSASTKNETTAVR